MFFVHGSSQRLNLFFFFFNSLPWLIIWLSFLSVVDCLTVFFIVIWLGIRDQSFTCHFEREKLESRVDFKLPNREI